MKTNYINLFQRDSHGMSYSYLTKCDCHPETCNCKHKKNNEKSKQTKGMSLNNIQKNGKTERMYSEKEVIEILLNFRAENPRYIEEWFEQFKKK
jgi:hypothetical protein